MSVLRWVKGHKKTTASIAVVSAAAVALGVLAFTYEGFTQTDVDLHDGGVWVTKTDTSYVGHLNVQAQALDGGFPVPSGSTDFDVLQDGDWVFLRDADGALIQIDPSSLLLGTTVVLPPTWQVQQHGGTLAILADDGRLWAMPVGSVGGFDEGETEPLAELGDDAVLAVGLDGAVVAASPDDGSITRWEVDDEGAGEPEVETREGIEGAGELSLTLVGDEAVALDAESGTLMLPGGSAEAPEGAVLQQVGTASTSVLLATGDLLVRQPLGLGEAVQQRLGEGGGAGIAPVQLNGCLYAAFPSNGQFVRTCDDTSRNEDQVIPELDAEARFRVNRDQVVLNEFESGQSWLVTDEVVLVDNWTDLIPPESEEESDEQDESLEESLQNTVPPPSEENHAPVATADDFGARPGRSSILPVLANDSDQDGDVLTARVTSELPSGITVAPIANDSQLQISVPEDFAEGVVRFDYEVDDGRGGTAAATVTVIIRGPNENSPPEPLFEQGFEIEQTATFEYSALQGWFDPDGDDFYLESAQSPTGDQIESSPAGRIVYTATGDAGVTSVDMVVTDGTDSTPGAIKVTVRERDTATIIPNADFVSTIDGREVSFEPLANDYVPGTQGARVAQVSFDVVPQVQGTVDLGTGIVTITGGDVGTWYLTYLAVSGQSSESGRIRVDIREADDEARPVAVRDIALLPQQGETLVDLLANDIDPSGGVLVVQSVVVDGTPVSAQLLERRVLRLLDTQSLAAQSTISYTVSNGRFTETGEVVIIPVPPPDQPRQPTAVADTATVREGDFVTIPVLENDFSPDNVPLTVSPELVSTSLEGEEEGYAFVDGDRVRLFVAEGGPSTVRLTYEISDEFQATASATVDVTVVPRGESNDPPTAQTVTARVVEGNTVRIPIPLDGIDPDGDGVELVRAETAPDAGRILEAGDGFFLYEAYPESAGTVSFTYRVRDRWGAEATAAVIIGIAPVPTLNQKPFAERDEVTVQPDRRIAVPVLSNDFDPDGDSLTLQTDGIAEASPELGDSVSVDEDRNTVDFTAPSDPGEYSLRYTIDDGRGGETVGIVLITVDPEADPEPPIAVDDVIRPADVTAGDAMTVPVLDNDLDPDGSPDTLDVEIVLGPGDPATDGVRVVPNDETFQVVTYRVTDPDGETAEAFVFVPIARDPVPRLLNDDPIPVPSGESREFDLADYVWVAQNAPRITTSEKVDGTNDDGSDLVVDVDTLQYTSEAGYTGPATLSFEVTDGTDVDDPEGNVALLSLELIVQPSSAVPPSFSGAELEVAQGTTYEFDLTRATQDPDAGDVEEMDYELVAGASEVLTANLDDQVLAITAPVDAPVGSTTSYTVELEDPSGNAVQGSVVARVTLSNEPLASVRDDVAEAIQGEPTVVNALANDYNPFQGSAPLRIADVEVIGGDGDPTTDGSTVTVTPAADFSGVLTVRYIVRDATNSAQREVPGQITVNVKGRPEPPIRPNVLSVGDQTVTLAWAAPNANGDPITGYVVSSSDGAFSQPCASTTCEIAGLTNNVTYTFTVVAQNTVGDSDPSPASSEARPDVRPEPPGAPAATRGDGQLAVAWAEPVNNGSPITSYLLEISPPPPSGSPTVVVEGGATSYDWLGLTNGTAYTFRVQARNDAPEPSDFSPSSAPQTPAGRPFQVAGVSAVRDTSIPGSVQVTVSWAEHSGQSNGAAISGYTVTASNGATTTASGAGATSATFGQGSLPAGAGATLTFTVTATNDVGVSDASAASNGVRDAITPGAPTITGHTDGNGVVSLQMQAGPTNGFRSEEITYTVYRADGTRVGTVGPTGGDVSLANRDTPYTLYVVATAQAEGISFASGQSNRRDVQPFGPPPAPNARVEGGRNQVTFFYSPNGTNGRPLDRLEYVLNDQSTDWQPVRPAANGQFSMPFEPGRDACIQVRVFDTEGTVSQSTYTCGQALPDPSITLSRGPVFPGCNGTCYKYQLNFRDLPAGTYNYQCFNTGSGNGAGNPFNVPNPGSVQISGGNGSTTAGSNAGGDLCYSEFNGQAWMRVWGNGIDIETPRINWP